MSRLLLIPVLLVAPLVLLSVPMAVGIHTVTAFLYNGLAARPYWNSSILAPQFLASAFCSGPAILLIMGVVVVFILISLYLPIFSLGQTGGGQG